MKNFLITLLFSLTVSSATANNRYTNFDGQGVWTENSSSPAIEVTLKGSALYAKLADQKLPAIRLKTINSRLLNEYTEQYIKMQDYSGDGYTDIAVLKSVGFAGENRCYSVFEYLPSFYSFRSRSSKTICY